MIRTLIVEDHPIVSKDIVRLMEAEPGFAVLAQAASVKEALLLIEATAPDLLLMDIQLKDGTAFDILEQKAPLAYRVIFLTAFEQYALRAIKYGALDYLLKPIDGGGLHLALQKVLDAAPVAASQLHLAKQYFQQQKPGRIAIRDGQMLHLVNLDQLVYACGAGEHTTFVLADGQRIQTTKRLKEYDELLSGIGFLRPHQSYLVNVSFVTRYHHRDGYLLLSNREEIPVSERRQQTVMETLTRL